MKSRAVHRQQATVARLLPVHPVQAHPTPRLPTLQVARGPRHLKPLHQRAQKPLRHLPMVPRQDRPSRPPKSLLQVGFPSILRLVLTTPATLLQLQLLLPRRPQRGQLLPATQKPLVKQRAPLVKPKILSRLQLRHRPQEKRTKACLGVLGIG